MNIRKGMIFDNSRCTQLRVDGVDGDEVRFTIWRDSDKDGFRRRWPQAQFVAELKRQKLREIR